MQNFFLPPNKGAFLLALAYFPKELEAIPNNVSACWTCFSRCLQTSSCKMFCWGGFNTACFYNNFKHLDTDHMASFLTLLIKAGWHSWLEKIVFTISYWWKLQSCVPTRLADESHFCQIFHPSSKEIIPGWEDFICTGFRKLKIKMKIFLLREIFCPV